MQFIFERRKWRIETMAFFELIGPIRRTNRSVLVFGGRVFQPALPICALHHWQLLDARVHIRLRREVREKRPVGLGELRVGGQDLYTVVRIRG